MQIPDKVERQSLEALVTSLGTAAFADAMLLCLNTISHIDHFSIVSLSGGKKAELVSSASLPGEHPTPSAQNAYIDRYHQIDPNRRILSSRSCDHGTAIAACLVNRLERDQINDSGYRHDCYIRPGLLDRYSIILPEQTRIHCLNLYRFSESGHFHAQDLDKLGQHAALLAAFTSKQCALVGAGYCVEARAGSLEHMAQRLRAMKLGLSRRELEVAARILQGYSSEAIALDLDISVNTVLTYRKRTYAKAGINSQNALFALCLGKTRH
ncbi:MAG: helix-turn-helix transcriptional regulator [Fimbriimonadaceae bacterium]|nr:helix-turn-helix transcriptional regulator [Alphaproteobacteria bacterium]